MAPVHQDQAAAAGHAPRRGDEQEGRRAAQVQGRLRPPALAEQGARDPLEFAHAREATAERTTPAGDRGARRDRGDQEPHAGAQAGARGAHTGLREQGGGERDARPGGTRRAPQAAAEHRRPHRAARGGGADAPEVPARASPPREQAQDVRARSERPGGAQRQAGQGEEAGRGQAGGRDRQPVGRLGEDQAAAQAQGQARVADGRPGGATAQRGRAASALREAAARLRARAQRDARPAWRARPAGERAASAAAEARGRAHAAVRAHRGGGQCARQPAASGARVPGAGAGLARGPRDGAGGAATRRQGEEGPDGGGRVAAQRDHRPERHELGDAGAVQEAERRGLRAQEEARGGGRGQGGARRRTQDQVQQAGRGAQPAARQRAQELRRPQQAQADARGRERRLGQRGLSLYLIFIHHFIIS